MTHLTPYLTLFATFIGALIVSLVGSTYALGRLRHTGVLDQPNARSNHSVPTPRGGGIAVVLTVVAFGFFMDLPPGILVSAVFLAGVSWADDRISLSPYLRIIAHMILIACALTSFEDPVFGGYIPEPYDVFIALFLWLWFINLFNFMDGIDGIACTEAAMVGFGVSIVALVAGVQQPAAAYGAVIAGASVAFLAWNWHPAKMFLGDAGSVPIGLLVGYALLLLVHANLWEPALILPLYFIADASITLAARIRNKEKIFQAHSKHYYQRAVRAGVPHHSVVRRMMVLNVVLIGLAVGSVTHPFFPGAWLLLAIAAVGLFLMHLAGLARRVV